MRAFVLVCTILLIREYERVCFKVVQCIVKRLYLDFSSVFTSLLQTLESSFHDDSDGPLVYVMKSNWKLVQFFLELSHVEREGLISVKKILVFQGTPH